MHDLIPAEHVKDPERRAHHPDDIRQRVWQMELADFARRLGSLQSLLASLEAESADAFVRPELGARMGFESLRRGIEDVLKISRALHRSPLDQLPFHVFHMAETAYTQIDARLAALKSFDALALSSQNTNVKNHHLNLETDFRRVEDEFWPQITPVIGFLGAIRLESDVTAVTAQALLKQAEEAVERATLASGTIEQIAGAAREASANIGVSRHATLFAAEADRQELIAKHWLIGTVVFTVLTLGLAGLNVVAHVRGWDSPTAGAIDHNRVDVGLVLAKIFAFSLLLSAIVWCGRIYKAARHNAVVNRHRQNALSTFQSFVEGGTDDQTRNAVLLQASQCVFAPQISGFVTGEPDGAGPTQMIEMVRTISPAQR